MVQSMREECQLTFRSTPGVSEKRTASKPTNFLVLDTTAILEILISNTLVLFLSFQLNTKVQLKKQELYPRVFDIKKS